MRLVSAVGRMVVKTWDLRRLASARRVRGYPWEALQVEILLVFVPIVVQQWRPMVTEQVG